MRGDDIGAVTDCQGTILRFENDVAAVGIEVGTGTDNDVIRAGAARFFRCVYTGTGKRVLAGSYEDRAVGVLRTGVDGDVGREGDVEVGTEGDVTLRFSRVGSGSQGDAHLYNDLVVG